jgi:hypothetical protein
VFFDLADEVVTVPKAEDIRVIDPEVYLKRLSDIDTPNERLIEFIKSQFYPPAQATHEVTYIRMMGFAGLAFGWLFGGISRSKRMFEQFQQQHNASVFDNKHRANRLYVDNYFYTTIRRGAKYGIGAGLFCSTAGMIGFGSITYRNQLYLPDWLIGFGTFGAVTRCWLGLRGVVFGAGIGLIGGTLGYGCAKFLELTSGKSVTQLRYLNHVDYLQKRQAELDRIHRFREETDREFLNKIS